MGDHTPLFKITPAGIAVFTSTICLDGRFVLIFVVSFTAKTVFFPHRLRVFGVNHKVMFLFYKAVSESILRYSTSVW